MANYFITSFNLFDRLLLVLWVEIGYLRVHLHITVGCTRRMFYRENRSVYLWHIVL